MKCYTITATMGWSERIPYGVVNNTMLAKFLATLSYSYRSELAKIIGNFNILESGRFVIVSDELEVSIKRIQ